MYFCVSCEVGLHSSCYESYTIKPMNKIDNDKFVCIPCVALATQINQEEVDIDGKIRQFKNIIIINYK